jgi:flagellar protein FlbD
MIRVTKLDGTGYLLNPHQIESIEVRPDTTLIMLSGKVHILKEEVDTVLERIVAYHRSINPYVVQE